jgi:diguanylate cyclase (GGDEF)-like protein/PAS domain S-box-containing protein
MHSDKMSQILIVDDCPLSVSLLERLVHAVGGEAVCFTDARKALEWAFANPADIILVDYYMPDIDGLEFIRQVRDSGPNTTTPILMISSSDEDALLQPALEAGANDFLQKPVNRAEFLARTRSMLQLRQNERQLIEHSLALEKKVQDATAELRRSQERYYLAAQASRDGLWDWNLETGEVFFSAYWCEMIGYRESDLPALLSTWFNRVHPDDIAELRSSVDAYLAKDMDFLSCEYRLRHRNGSYCWMSTRGLCMRNDRGEPHRLIGTQTNITDRKKIEARLAHTALHDALTGLPNRVLLTERLQQAFMRYKRDKSNPFAVMFLDLDRFKQVNDTLGHAAGDQLLLALAPRMKRCCREADTVARLSGDEFVLLLPDTSSLEDVEQVAKRLLDEIQRPLTIAGKTINPSASIGIAFADDSFTAYNDILKDADSALYEAKKKGRSSYVIFDPESRHAQNTTLHLQEALKKAVTDEELRVCYQPILDLKTQRIVGFEALARWQHPELGLIMPDHFLHYAEEGEEIIKLDRFVARKALQQVREWRDTYGEDYFLSLNISTKHFYQKGFAPFMKELCHEANFPMQKLVLELSEKTIQESLETAERLFAFLKQEGYELALDDFGNGPTSLYGLSAFNFSYIKVDRRVIANLQERPHHQKFLNLMTHIGQDVEATLIFEGVETKSEYDYLFQHTQGLTQGFYFQKPAMGSEIKAFLDETAQRGRAAIRA